MTPSPEVENWNVSRCVLLDRSVATDKVAAMIRDGDRLRDALSLAQARIEELEEFAKRMSTRRDGVGFLARQALGEAKP